MQTIRKYIPNYILKFLLKMGALVLIFSLCRLVFLWYNWNQFEEVYFSDFIIGLWFDLVTAAIAFLPLCAIEILPNKWRDTKAYDLFLNISFQLIVFLTVLLNLIDVGYFQHTSSRSKASLIDMLQFGSDAEQTIPSYIINYWYLLLCLILFQWLSIWLYKRINRIDGQSKSTPWWLQITYVPIMIFVLVAIGRGGFGLKPIAPAKAARYTTSANMPLVLNTAFTVIKSWGESGLKEKHFFEEDELLKRFNPIKKYDGSAEMAQDNVVLIVLESFAIQYIGSLNDEGVSYTPFFDSLVGESLVMKECFANGKKSMDAMPSLISSIPKLMEEEYITSSYAANEIESLPKALKKMGYESSFYHGASNGSMNFDVYCDLAHFDKYFGRTEYNNEADFDGTWGIFDEPFLLWSLEKMNENAKPFFSTIFTISSHDPYTIPDQHKEKFNSGPSAMHNAIAYVDYSLEKFFEAAKKQPWYAQTLFILTADHTPASGEPGYFKEIGKMRIPMIFFHPTNRIFKGEVSKVTSQNDVMPTLLDLLGFEEEFFAIGQSIFDKAPGYSVSQIGESVLFFGDYDTSQYLGMMHDEELTHIYELNDQLQKRNLYYTQPSLIDPISQKLYTFIQTYNKALIQNRMTAERSEQP